MQTLVDVLKWFGVEASGWSVSVCLFLLFLSLLYWWVKQFHHEVSKRKTHTLLFTDCNGRFLMTDVSNAFWEVSTTVRSEQLRLALFSSGEGQRDLIKFQSHVSLHLCLPVWMQTAFRFSIFTVIWGQGWRKFIVSLVTSLRNITAAIVKTGVNP